MAALSDDRSRDALGDVLAAAAGLTHRDDPVRPDTGGPAGNARLTAWIGLLLLGGFLAEGVTLISVGHLITAHILIGTFLVPLVIFKTATTGWRMVKYYLRSADYQQAGPPPTLLRLLGPLVVLTGLAVLGSGLALIALGQSTYRNIATVGGFRINALSIHQGAFIAWLAVMGLHVLTRTIPAWKVVTGNGRHDHEVPGSVRRGAALVAIVVTGVLVSLLVVHFSTDWTHHRVDKFRDGSSIGRHGSG
jgi:hypothetical protein